MVKTQQFSLGNGGGGEQFNSEIGNFLQILDNNTLKEKPVWCSKGIVSELGHNIRPCF